RDAEHDLVEHDGRARIDGLQVSPANLGDDAAPDAVGKGDVGARRTAHGTGNAWRRGPHRVVRAGSRCDDHGAKFTYCGWSRVGSERLKDTHGLPGSAHRGR